MGGDAKGRSVRKHQSAPGGARPRDRQGTPPRDRRPAISHLLVGEARLREDEEERILPLRLPRDGLPRRAGGAPRRPHAGDAAREPPVATPRPHYHASSPSNTPWTLAAGISVAPGKAHA